MRVRVRTRERLAGEREGSRRCVATGIRRQGVRGQGNQRRLKREKNEKGQGKGCPGQ